MPRPEEELIALLRKHGVDFTASLPCEKIKTLIAMTARELPHLPLTREEEGVGICAGAALAGRRPALFVQSSGLGNMINALLSLTQFYALPLAVFVSRRGVYKEKIDAQIPMGQRLPAILSGAGIPYTTINNPGDIALIDRELLSVYGNYRVHAFLMSPAVWEKSECAETISPIGGLRSAVTDDSGRRSLSTPSLTRFEVIKALAPVLDGKAVVCNLGWPSKELYAIKHQPSNFYMLGSMGMALPIGLGMAMSATRDVVVIEGDGSLLMNPGTLATVAYAGPKNLTIVAIDNGTYGSTGDQPTLAASCVDLEQVARGFGFRNTTKVASEGDLTEALQKRSGPSFIHVLAKPGNKDVPNIPVHHLEIRKQVQEFLREEKQFLTAESRRHGE